MKDLDSKVMEALAHSFNSPKVQGLSNEQYKQYIEASCSLTIGTLIANEGKQFVKDFCQAALDCTEPMPMVKQVKVNH